jgi:hypothetical protein
MRWGSPNPESTFNGTMAFVFLQITHCVVLMLGVSDRFVIGDVEEHNDLECRSVKDMMGYEV